MISKTPYPYNLIKAALGDDACVDARRVPQWISTLSDREKEVIRLRYEEDMTLEQVGKEFDVTRERIRQVEAKALRKLSYPPRAKEIKTVSMAEFERMKIQKDAEYAELYKRHNALQGHIERLEAALAKEVPSLSETIEVLSESYFAEKPEVRDIPLSDLDLSVRSYNCLARFGIKTARDIEEKTEDEMMHIRNLGRRSMQEISERLKELGFEPKF